ncbi:MAG: flagellar hook capping protein, partial [Agathobacter sp.]|nr:flagellar hook capping protein [Agathobacter sp.]
MPIVAPIVDGELSYDYTDGKKKGINPTGSTLGYDQFLQLLCAEMQYQDPLEPTSNTDYVAQMATFSQLEATLSLTETQESANASELVGKQVILKVTSETTGETTYVDGRVDYVMYQNGEAYLSVNDQLYPASTLDTVADTEYYEGVTLAETLTNMVDALPSMENLSLSYQKGIEQLRELYDSMTSYQQQFVPGETLEKLREYEERIEELVKQAEENSTDDTTTDDTSTEEGESGSEETTV